MIITWLVLFFYSVDTFKNGVVIVKRSVEDSSFIWNKTIELVNASRRISRESILAKEESFYTLIGYCNTSSYVDYALLSKWNTEGEFIWSLKFKGLSNPSLYGDEEKVYIVAQTGRDTIPSYPFLIKVSNGGVID